MKQEVRCYRCGKPFTLSYKDMKHKIVCDHCHGIMVMDYPSQKKNKYVRMMFVMLVVSALVYAMSQFKSEADFVTTIWIVATAAIITFFADKLCLYLTVLMFRIGYVEYHQPERSKTVKGRKK